MMSDGGSQSSKTRVRNTLQDPPESLVPDPANIEADSPVQSPAPQDQKTAVGDLVTRISISRWVSHVFSLMGKVFYSWLYPQYVAKKFSICKVYKSLLSQHSSKTRKFFLASFDKAFLSIFPEFLRAITWDVTWFYQDVLVYQQQSPCEASSHQNSLRNLWLMARDS